MLRHPMVHRSYLQKGMFVATATAGLAILPMVLPAACSSSSAPVESVKTEAGMSTQTDTGTGHLLPDSGTTTDTGKPATDAGLHIDAGMGLKSFPVGGPPDPGPGAFYVTISGESNAINGYPFPPDNYSSDTYMYDGWQFEIEAYIVIVDKITLWSMPNTSCTDQSQHGPAVAELTGPFVVDLHKGGAIIGQGGYPEQATPIGVITNQNLVSGSPALDPTVTYGWGFSTIPAGTPFAGYTGEVAGYNAYNVNLTPDEADDYAYMVEHGASVYYRGHAVWLGNTGTYACTQTNAGNPAGVFDGGPPDGGAGITFVPDGSTAAYDFTKMPEKGLNFRFAFATPTNYVNCQNYTSGLPGQCGEANSRGVQVNSATSAITQVTVHMDHPFWQRSRRTPPSTGIRSQDSTSACRTRTAASSSRTSTTSTVCRSAIHRSRREQDALAQLRGPLLHGPRQRRDVFTTLSVPVRPGPGTPRRQELHRDYYDYIRYTQSTQGHLNSQGLCYIDRQFPSPGGGS